MASRAIAPKQVPSDQCRQAAKRKRPSDAAEAAEVAAPRKRAEVSSESVVKATAHPGGITLKLRGVLPSEAAARYASVIGALVTYVPTTIRGGPSTVTECEVTLSKQSLRGSVVLHTLHADHGSSQQAREVPLEANGPFWAILQLIVLLLGGEASQCLKPCPRANLVEVLQVADFLDCPNVVAYCVKNLNNLLNELVADAKHMPDLDCAHHVNLRREKRALLEALKYVPQETLTSVFIHGHWGKRALDLPAPLASIWLRARVSSKDRVTFTGLAPNQWAALAAAAKDAALQATSMRLYDWKLEGVVTRGQVYRACSYSRPIGFEVVNVEDFPGRYDTDDDLDDLVHEDDGSEGLRESLKACKLIPWTFSLLCVSLRPLLSSCPCLTVLSLSMRIAWKEAGVLLTLLAGSTPGLKTLRLEQIQPELGWTWERLLKFVELAAEEMDELTLVDLSDNMWDLPGVVPSVARRTISRVFVEYMDWG